MKFDIDRLAEVMRQQCPQIRFCFLHGSAKDGEVKEGSDIDIALFIEGKSNWQIYSKVFDVVASIAPDAQADIGILNNAEPVYRFESLKGRLLFARDQEEYLRFFSLTCRQYEFQMADYERQRRYRLETASGTILTTD